MRRPGARDGVAAARVREERHFDAASGRTIVPVRGAIDRPPRCGRVRPWAARYSCVYVCAYYVPAILCRNRKQTVPKGPTRTFHRQLSCHAVVGCHLTSAAFLPGRRTDLPRDTWLSILKDMGYAEQQFAERYDLVTTNSLSFLVPTRCAFMLLLCVDCSGAASGDYRARLGTHLHETESQ